jgi:predicted TIM-barrel fold metal-dependent hydrolase
MINRLTKPGIVVLVAVGLISSVQGISSAGQAMASGWIDAHTHLLGRFGGPRGGQDNFPGAVGTALKDMDALGIGASVVMPMPFSEGQAGAFDLDDILPAVAKLPGRFAVLGGGLRLNGMIQKASGSKEIDPSVREEFTRRAEEIARKGARGFGEVTALHLALGPRHPYQGASPDHPLFLLLADLAVRFGLPMDLHMEAVPRDMPIPERLAMPQNPKMLPANLEAFKRLLTHNPQARIIWAHAGWDNTGARTPALMRELLVAHPNLYMSLKGGRDCDPANLVLDSGGRIKAEWLALLREFSDRFILGSDTFHLPPDPPQGMRFPDRFPFVRALFADLPPDLAAKIGRDNALRLFGLE